MKWGLSRLISCLTGNGLKRGRNSHGGVGGMPEITILPLLTVGCLLLQEGIPLAPVGSTS